MAYRSAAIDAPAAAAAASSHADVRIRSAGSTGIEWLYDQRDRTPVFLSALDVMRGRTADAGQVITMARSGVLIQ
jgi:hypothetical protein